MKQIQVRNKVIPLAVAAGLMMSSGPAYAASPTASPAGGVAVPKASAADLFSSGEGKYKAADYAGALTDFEAADAVKPNSETARYVGLCEDKLGNYPAAAMAYNRFLAHPTPKSVDEVGPVVERVRAIEQMPGTVRIDVQPQGASLAVDGAPERNTAPYEAHLSPGKHLVRASAPNYEALEREVNVTFASVEEVTLTLTPATPALVPPAPALAVIPPPLAQVVVVPSAASAPPITRRAVAFAAAGIAVIGAGVATTFGVLALNNKSEWERSPTLSNSDRGNNDAAYADGALALTVAAGVTSLVLFLTDDAGSSPTEPTRANTARFSASPFVTPHGGGGGALVHF